MDRRHALEVLGLDDTANEQDIIDAHRRLMQKLHPDRGGSNYLAATLNEAKRTLLN
jgi:DnaJ-class molecular chaperone